MDHQLFNPFTFEGVNPLNIQFIDFDRPQVEEASFAFDEKLFTDCPDWISLVGFLQSEKYFKHIEDTVHSMFSFRGEAAEVKLDLRHNPDFNIPPRTNITR